MHTHHHKPAPRARLAPTATPAVPVAHRVTGTVEDERPAAPLTPDDVRLRAYHLWELAGRPAGDGVGFWLEAEHELVERS